VVKAFNTTFAGTLVDGQVDCQRSATCTWRSSRHSGRTSPAPPRCSPDQATSDHRRSSLAIRPGALWGYLVAISVILQVVALPVTGALTDRTHRRRRLLAIFAYIGAFSTIGFFFVENADLLLLGCVLFVVANVTFGMSVVVYNSFLPRLAAPDDRDKVSSIGWALGYLGGGLLLLLNLIAYTFDDRALMVRISLASAGVWWAVFTTLPLARLRDPEPHEVAPVQGSALTGGFKQLGVTLKGMRAFPLTLAFLAVFLIYNDGVQTVISVTSQYASDYLELDQQYLIITILIVQFTAFGGALLMGRIARSFGARKTILGSLILWAGVVSAAYFLPVGQAFPFIGLGMLLGIVLGGTQALSRSLFSQMIPDGKEGEYFGFYEISDKGTSWLGPLVFAISFDITGSYQVAIISIAAFFVVGFLLLLLVPVRRAIVAAGNTPPHVL
jgi:UMF1 family MFS transporter